MFRLLRIAVLLLVLLVVALTSWQERLRSTHWTVPLYVAIYPVAGDSSPVTQAYLGSLEPAVFQPIDRFFAREGARYGLRTEQPVKTRLRQPLTELPPPRPQESGMLAAALWSLKLRFWAWRASRHAHEPEDIRVFVLYHDPALTQTVPHSAGLEKGLIGVVHAFATPTMGGANDVVIAHEMLHTLGATDKYDPANDEPRYPDGYGDPLQQPRFPQQKAEIMAGRRMLAPNRWEQPFDLAEVLIGQATATEIRWPRIGP